MNGHCGENSPLGNVEGETETLLYESTEKLFHKDAPETISDISICKKIKDILSNITVEPCIFMYLLAVSLQGILVTELILKKTCLVHFNFSEDICNNLTAYNKENSDVQKYTSQLNLYISLIESLPAVLFILFLGSWSDVYGRKIPLLFPLVGSCISTLIFITNVLNWSLSPEYILYASIPKAISGGFICLLMISYSYISDLSQVQNRTMRIAFIDISFALGPFVGLLFSDITYQKLGYLGVFGLSEGAFVLCIIYVLFFITETTGRNKGFKWCCSNINNQSDSPELRQPRVRNAYHLISAFKTGIKRRENYGRAKILALMAVMSIMSSIYELIGLEYLFVKKQLNWAYSQYVHLISYDTAVAAVGIVVFLPLLSRRLKLDDITLGIFGSFSKIAALGLTAFATASWVMYAAVTVGFLSFMPMVVVRAALSKLVNKDEIGKVFSLLACLEILLPLASKAIFTIIYDATLDTMPGAMFILGSGMYVMAAAILVWVFFLNKRIESGRQLEHNSS